MITSLNEVFFGLPTTPNFSFWRIIVYVLIWILASPVIWRVSESRGRLLKYWLSHHWNVISLKCSHIHTVFLPVKSIIKTSLKYMTKNLFKEWIHLQLEIRIPLERCFLQVPWNSIFHRICGNYFPSTQTSVLHEVCR